MKENGTVLGCGCGFPAIPGGKPHGMGCYFALHSKLAASSLLPEPYTLQPADRDRSDESSAFDWAGGRLAVMLCGALTISLDKPIRLEALDDAPAKSRLRFRR